ncbi:LysR family transcriptional regulator [Pelagibius litoralis]|uniref:LysR family transcriptional regulator n=1 Tax=Pelagibius litoralis TaxID=374515 RepID=A0A967F081_9PROT|nr:LysR family transcriptional regulator [Pelagibius litoralis]NIA70626.1 LysR family transcriptional regulator [Pelagibius litoralis]
MFELRDIEILNDIVQAGGFRAAAQKHDISQSAISSRIAALEKRLGIALFDRSNRRVRLTPAGRRFLEEAERLIVARDRIVQEITKPGSLSGTIRIGVAETIVHTILSDMLNKLKSDHQKVRFELSVDTSEQLSNALADDRIDVAILLQDSVPRGATASPLTPVALDWYCADMMALPAHLLSLRELIGHSIVTFPKSTTPYRELETQLSAPDIPQPDLHGCASLSTIIHLVSDGFGIGILPILMAEGEVRRGKLKQIPTCEAARLNALRFAVAYMPARNREVGETVTAAAKLFDRNDL